MTKRPKSTSSKSAGSGNDKGTGDYEVGFGKPPVHSRFEKGRSGNPKGKQKGRKNTKTMIREIAFAPMEVQVQGKAQIITAYEAALMKLRQSALSGDFRATQALLELARSVEETADAATSASPAVLPLDQSLLRALAKDFLDSTATNEGAGKAGDTANDDDDLEAA